jgi:hypothetical protein
VTMKTRMMICSNISAVTGFITVDMYTYDRIGRYGFYWFLYNVEFTTVNLKKILVQA